MFKGTFLTTAFVLATAGMVGGVTAGEDTESRFRALDTNDNGRLSHYEVKDRHHATYYYDMADANNDGSISLEELKAFEKAVPPVKARAER